MRGRGILAVAVVVASFAPAVAAESKSDEGKNPLKGLYFQLGPVASIEAFDLPSEFNTKDPAWGLDARVGYHFHPHLAAEADLQWVEGYRITSGGQNIGSIETYTFTLNGKVIAFDGPVTPYAIVGAGVQHAEANGVAGGADTEFAFRIGGGVDLRFWQGIGAYAEISYVQPATSLDNFGAVPISFGLKYEFQ